ncbi:hypothetical protein VP1G_04328 [Cytospora mali]|uniref:Uncharacterized protein n=1 Tax=Cytospora mali TaxID=578113 RepID=A0A194UZF4_CYTMA|nr:hypothetical protein VP1G_04328 [Valsa mali var. pyri (nom. inval.)]
MSVHKSLRATYCNVHIYTESAVLVTTIFQLNGLLRVKDVAYELELCLIFDEPDDVPTFPNTLIIPEAPECLLLANFKPIAYKDGYSRS